MDPSLILMLVLMFAMLYFFMIRPENKRCASSLPSGPCPARMWLRISLPTKSYRYVFSPPRIGFTKPWGRVFL